MALEYAPKIRFNCIAPAVGNTSMCVSLAYVLSSLISIFNRLQKSIGNDSESATRLRKLEETLPMKRVTEPSDVANAAWYLGCDQSSFVTGTTLEVDGGRGV